MNAIHSDGFATVYLKSHMIKVAGENYVNCETDLFSAAVTVTNKSIRSKSNERHITRSFFSKSVPLVHDHLYDRKALKFIRFGKNKEIYFSF